MAEIPDVLRCTTSHKKHTGAASSGGSQNVSSNADVLTMDAEDSLPAIATASAASEGASSFASTNTAQYHFAGDVPASERIEKLKKQELYLDPKNASSFYATLIGHYIALFDFDKVNLCRLRIEALPDKSDEVLKVFIAIAQHLRVQNFGAAIDLCEENNFTTTSLRHLMSEVKERLRLYTLLTVQKSYSNIEAIRLSQMLKLPHAQLLELITQCGWDVTLSGFVAPRLTPGFLAILDKTKNSAFRQVSLEKIVPEPKTSTVEDANNALKNLAKFISVLET